jgi:hypothetical protein
MVDRLPSGPQIRANGQSCYPFDASGTWPHARRFRAAVVPPFARYAGPPRWSRSPHWASRPAAPRPSPPPAPAAGSRPPKPSSASTSGPDYQLATYRQLAEYWRKLDAESDRLTLVDIGKTAEGRPQLMAIVTAPENQKRLARYQDIARRLALAEGLTDAQARALAAEGKAVVWIDGGLHATEVLGAQQLIETSYRLVSAEDERRAASSTTS